MASGEQWPAQEFTKEVLGNFEDDPLLGLIGGLGCDTKAENTEPKEELEAKGETHEDGEAKGEADEF